MRHIHFGTGGWRAVIGDEFTKDNICRVAKAMVSVIKNEKVEDIPVVMGYDRRFLSKEAMIWAAEVIASNGIKVKLVESSSPTPMIMHYTMVEKLKYGMMITASHNPSLYNGIKVFTEGGRDANEEFTAKLEAEIEKITVEDAVTGVKDIAQLQEEGMVIFFNPINRYLDDILKTVDLEAIRNAHLKIAVDALYGVSVRSLNTILSTARCDVEMLHSGHDTLFAGKMPAPDKQTVKALQNHVVDYDFDMGIATDGDADRIGLVDDRGRYVDANEILCILYYFFLEYKGMKTPVVKNLATTSLLDKIAEFYGQDCHEVPVGFKYISAKMAETGAFLGGEGSGGLTVAGHINGKDAVYAATLLVETIAKTGKKISELMEEVNQKFGRFYMLENNIAFAAKRKEELLDRIYNKHELPELGIKVEKTSYMDGCKVWFANGGWLLIRFSGTEPLLRVFVEMPKEDEALTYQVCDKIKKHFGI